MAHLHLSKSWGLALMSVLVAGQLGCGGSSAFGLQSDDNSTAQLTAVLTKHPSAAAPAPRNASGDAMVVLTGGAPKFLAAYNLTKQKLAWRVAADVGSRITIGKDLAVALEGKTLVAHDLATGAMRWKSNITGTLVGVAAGANHIVTVYKQGNSKPT